MGTNNLTVPSAATGHYRTAPAAVLTATVASLPFAWVAGMAPFVWLVAALFAGLALLRLPEVRGARYISLWGFFLLFVVASGTQLDGAGAGAVWIMRVGWYAGAAVLLLYLVNDDRPGIIRNISRALFGLWMITIVGGWLAVLVGELSWSGPIAKVLPGIIRDNPYIQDLTTPRLTETQRVGGQVFLRPTAPFTYTNNWGSTVALLTPLGIMAGFRKDNGIPVRLTVVMALLAVPPLLISLNRAAWASLAIAVLYGLFRMARLGRRGAVGVAAVLLIGGATIAFASGAVSTLTDQLSVRTGDSTEARLTLYGEALGSALESPVIGFGSPRASDELAAAPPVGTQGQVWMLLFSHGFPAAILYVAFFGLSFAYYPSRTPDAIWAKAALLAGMLQLPIYGHLPQQLFIMMCAVALLHHLSREPELPGLAQPLATGLNAAEAVPVR